MTKMNKDMKKIVRFCGMMLLVFVTLLAIASCGKDDDDDDNNNAAEPAFETEVVISDKGTASNGAVFSAIDDKSFYLDYIKYTVEDDHLVVSGYDKNGFKGKAKIVSSITYKRKAYKVTYLGDGAFGGCSSLSSITIPSSVTSIEQHAFYGCSSLTEIHSFITNPVKVSCFYCFDEDTYSNAIVYVPKGTLDAYKASNWNLFNNIEEE